MQELDINSIALVSGGEVTECHCTNGTKAYLENQSFNIIGIDPKTQCEDYCKDLGSSYKSHIFHEDHILCGRCDGFLKKGDDCSCWDSMI